MPWRRWSVTRERAQFVIEAAQGLWSVSELCARYGISRKTGYYWMARYRRTGPAGLEDRSRRPHRSPQAIDPTTVELVLEQRSVHPSWGPKKLLARVARFHPGVRLPGRSTVASWLKRRGLAKARGERRAPERLGIGLGGASSPNELWTTDYKGEFRLGNGHWCYPLTVVDAYSRFLLGCEGQAAIATEGARATFERLFREFGLPDRIGSDNGSPFGSTGIGGLSRLSVWWLKLGIRFERIEPGHPEQNGRHERMHRTLKEEAIPRHPPAPDLPRQQAEFDRFRAEFNQDRPHEALAGRVPADLYRPSWRPYLEETPGLDYPAHFQRRQVHGNGCMLWKGQEVYVSQTLKDEPVGLEEVSEGLWSLYFGPLLIGRICDGDHRLSRGTPTEPRRQRSHPPFEQKVLPMSLD